MERKNVTSGASWEQQYGYRRAVRVGPHIFVAGTAPVGEDGNTVSPGDAYAQAKHCFEVALKAVRDLGGDARHVVRTRMFVVDIRFAEDFGRAHAELFGEHPPACTLVEVRKLIGPDMLIEVEVDAIIHE
jgi:enamine deaminase RidA (YjgF/YER057c/UK114 family)